MAKKIRSEPAIEIVTSSVEETQAFGEQLGKLLEAGDSVALQGELGTGKTTLIQGITKGLGVTGVAVKSPTFVLVREYPGRVPVVHIDAYRLEGAPAAAWLDVDLLLGPEKVTLIEWAERVETLLPADHLRLELQHVSSNRRRIQVVPRGERAAKIAAALPRAQADAASAPEAPTEATEEGKPDVAGD